MPPIINHSSKVLILGSMPGGVSLQKQQYYAHTRNQFWPIVFTALGQHLPSAYTQRVDMLGRAGIAVWDVIASCHRTGSLDKDITQIKINDFLTLFNDYPSIKLVAFNGTKAQQVFRHIARINLPLHLVYETLPSTSPAHTKSIDEKLKSWLAIREYL